MHSKSIKENINFVGRTQDIAELAEIGAADKAQILIVYGRRRIGKTELIEQAYRKRNILKFEGLEKGTEQEQLVEVMRQLSEYTEQPLLARFPVKTWQEVFQHIAEAVKHGTWTVYFEEVQWLANYEDYFISALKYVWDNYFRHNNGLLLILCGSSPSFMINHIIHSKALYNRSSFEMGLSKLTLLETQLFLPGKSQQEIMDAYLTIGGVPEYLLWLKRGTSVFLSLCKCAFRKNSLFVREYNKIFVSSLSDNPHYKRIIEFLAKRRFATRLEIAKHIKIASGGSLTKLLEDLELCEFIQKYTPYNLSEESPLARYCIQDEYLQFYFKFIKPIQPRILAGEFDQEPSRAISLARYHQWLGYSFERFCRNNYKIIAKILDFAGIGFDVGTFFSRNTDGVDPGFQIDLLFKRRDKVYTICEIKCLQSKVGTSIIEEFERKLNLFPNKENYTIQRVLITNTEADQALINRAYFDRVITFKEIFDARYWQQ